MIIDKVRAVFQGNQRSVAVKKNIVASFFLRGISILVSLLLVPATIGYVSAELYGVWLTVASIMTWVHFLDLGFTQGLKNKLTEAIAKNDFQKGKSLVSTTYFMMIIIFLPVILILELLVPLVDWAQLLNVDLRYSYEVTQVMHLVLALACLQMIVNVLVSVIASFQQVALSNSFIVIGNVISLGLILLLKEFCPPSLIVLALTLGTMPIIVTIVASFILFCGRFRSVAPSWNSINRKYIKDLFNLGYKFFIINVQVLVLYWSTNVLISNVSSPIEVTRYNIAYKLLSIAMMVYTIITSPLWPAYTDAYAKEDYRWMKNMRKKMEKVLLYSVCFCLLLILLSPFLYNIWIGDKVYIPYTMTVLVGLYVIAYCWMNLNGTLVVGMGKVKVETIIVILGMLFHFPFSIYLSKYVGAYGVIISLIIINLFYAVVMNIQVSKILNKKAIGIWNE